MKLRTRCVEDASKPLSQKSELIERRSRRGFLAARMSAHGYKQTCGEVRQRVRFTPESGHSDAQERYGLKKRTLDVCFTPESGHKWVIVFMSGYDPTQTFPENI